MARVRPILAAFDQGQIPTIACINDATLDLGVNFDALVAAMQKFLDKHFIPVWGTPARLVKAKKFKKKDWAILFMNDADEPGALGYHDLTPEGLPLSKVFVRTTISNGDKVSVTASHELAEMLVDPAINLVSTGPKGLLYAYETADAVEAEEFNVDGIPMTNFVYPSWFEEFRAPKSTKFDHLGSVTRPFQILPGGYMPVLKKGKWTEIFGSKAKAKRFKREKRLGHRSEYRDPGEHKKLVRSR